MIEIRGKSFFLTYPKCNVELMDLYEGVKERFSQIGGRVCEYIVAHELHEDGYSHRHLFIGLGTGIRLKTKADCLDVAGHHPNIQSCRNIDKVLKYVTKGENFKTNIQNRIARALEVDCKKSKKEIAKEIIAGKQLIEVVDENPELLFGFSRLKLDIQAYWVDKKKVEDLKGVCGVWIAGPPGAGKSTITSRLGCYYKGRNVWWDGYGGEDNVVIEDVDESCKPWFNLIKLWADRYPFLGEVKGGTIRIRPLKIYITSNYTLEEALERMGYKEPDYGPFQRRFTQYWITSLDDWEQQL